MPTPSPAMRSSGFTLIELLIVIAIIGILAGILFPVINQARARANRASCQSNLRNIGAAMNGYLGDNNMQMPQISANDQYRQFEILGPYIDSEWNILTCPSARSGTDGATWPSVYCTTVDNEERCTDYKLSDHFATAGFTISKVVDTRWFVIALDIDWTDEQRHNGGQNLVFLDGHVEWMTPEEYRDPATAFDPYGNSPWFNWSTQDNR